MVVEPFGPVRPSSREFQPACSWSATCASTLRVSHCRIEAAPTLRPLSRAHAVDADQPDVAVGRDEHPAIAGAVEGHVSTAPIGARWRRRRRQGAIDALFLGERGGNQSRPWRVSTHDAQFCHIWRGRQRHACCAGTALRVTSRLLSSSSLARSRRPAVVASSGGARSALPRQRRNIRGYREVARRSSFFGMSARHSRTPGKRVGLIFDRLSAGDLRRPRDCHGRQNDVATPLYRTRPGRPAPSRATAKGAHLGAARKRRQRAEETCVIRLPNLVLPSCDGHPPLYRRKARPIHGSYSSGSSSGLRLLLHRPCSGQRQGKDRAGATALGRRRLAGHARSGARPYSTQCTIASSISNWPVASPPPQWSIPGTR